MSANLLDDPPLLVLPSLACVLGLNESIVLQQLHFLLRNPKNGKRIAEHKWIFNTYEQWQCEYFPFWSARTIQRIFETLAKRKLVVWCQPEGKVSRRKYYRIDTERLSEITEHAKLARSRMPDWHEGRSQSGTIPYTETTFTETSSQRGLKEAKETAKGFAETPLSFSAEWKPIQGTKAEKLKRIRPPKDYPQERQFFDWLEAEGMDSVLMYRDDTYSDLCLKKWHVWNEGAARWTPIRDWKAYVAGLNAKIEESKGGF